jgi:hypothetical protein
LTDIFISYARADRPRIAILAAALETAGYQIWWDRHLAAGAEFSRETAARLQDAKAVLVAWSQTSIDSMWVADEATIGRTRHILIPVCIDRIEPPLGFRQIQTIDLVDWKGDPSEPLFKELCASLDIALGGAATTAAPIEAAPVHAKHFRVTRRQKLLGGIGVALAAIVSGVAIFANLPGTPAPAKTAPSSIADVDDQTQKALAVIGTSSRSEDQAAYKSFVAGDQRGALEILETLAADLEKSGATDAAAEAYTRAGAVAILVDQGRGLVDRRKAMALKPESMTGYLGLFFDIFLLQGYDSAMRFATEMEARPNLSRQMRGFVRATMAIIETDGAHDFGKAEQRISEIRKIRNGDNDPVLLASEYWASSQIEWRRDNLTLAAEENARAKQQASRLPRDFPQLFDVMDARISFAAGDWRRSFDEGVSDLTQRQRKGDFIPMPLLATTCVSGLSLNETAQATPFCQALTGQQSTGGDAQKKIYASLVAAAEGNFEEARADLDAADALADIPNDSERAFMLEARAFVAGKAHDIDGAEHSTLELSKLLSTAPALMPSRRSSQANALRRLAQWAIDAGVPARACNPLDTAKSLYVELGAQAGAAAVDDLIAAAKCAPA